MAPKKKVTKKTAKKAAPKPKAKAPKKMIRKAASKPKAAAKRKANLGSVPRWDLSNVYPGLESAAFQAAVAELSAQLDGIDAYLVEQRIEKHAAGPLQTSSDAQAQVLAAVLDKMNAAMRLYGTLNAYIASFTTTDSFNQTARRIESEVEQYGVRLRKIDVSVRGWVGSLSAGQLAELTRRPGTLAEHSFYLQEMHAQSGYLMDAKEEALAAELSLSGSNAWGKLQNTTNSQLSVEFKLDGKLQKLPMPALINLRSHADPEVRRRGYEAEIAAFDTVKEVYAAAMNGVKGEVNTLNQRRGRSDALHASIDTSRIDRQTLDAMMEAMQDSFPTFRRYFKAKAKRLGKKSLAWWDLFAPMGSMDRTYTYQQARDFILEQFGNFSADLQALAQRAFDNNWIDAEMREGKSAGAFCMEVPGVDESRILANFDGSMDQLSTLAHELGHAYHNECLVGKTYLQATTPMTLAETASIMCETIINNASLKLAQTPGEKLAILENQLLNASQVVVDITSRFLFEKEVFERRAKAELSADELCEIMERAQLATYGDGLDPKQLHKYMWTWKPHYYYAGFSFYNYPYAFGLLFGTGLYAIYQQRGAEFTKDYRDLLASTGLGDAATLAQRFGINIREKKFWQDSLAVIGQQIEEYVNLKA
ncbi:MAG: M3 family oligoendopeptidase [Anaerolineales bacterium]|jgi:pepF/M3 family oligoendopeptidase|nr:M3 family oligoendopeptidase [Anaerolineales bacterium]